MSVLTNEASQQQAPTAEIYEFVYGNGSYNYTSHQESLYITATGIQYLAVPMKRGALPLEIDAEKINIKINIYFKGTLFESLRTVNNPEILVYIKKCLLSDVSDNYRLFTGKIIDIQYERQEAIITCVAGGYDLDRTIPTTHIQRLCNNILFDTKCGLTRASREIQVKVTDRNYDWGIDYGYGGVLIVTDYQADAGGRTVANQAVSYFKGGYIKHNNEFVTIYQMLNNNGDYTIYTLFQISAAAGDIISIFPGCNRSPETCKDTFDNLTNFVGFPYLPSLDPPKWGLKEIT